MKGSRTGIYALPIEERKKVIIEQSFAKVLVHPRTKKYRQNYKSLK